MENVGLPSAWTGRIIVLPDNSTHFLAWTHRFHVAYNMRNLCFPLHNTKGMFINEAIKKETSCTRAGPISFQAGFHIICFTTSESPPNW